MNTERIAESRKERVTHYGHAITPKEDAMAKKTTKYAKYQPVSDEVTVYGAKKFRTPAMKNEFVGTRGSKLPAYILDIDGTLQTYGSSADPSVMKWVKEIYEKDNHTVFLVITARDHGGFGFTSSFNWLLHNFPYPFIGPFARPIDDPRYASEFKREMAQGFEDMGLYQIMGAADDNEYVIKMWKQWAIDHFDNPEDFKLFEASYGSYDSWRSDLPSKGTSSYGTYTGGTYYNQHKDEHWENHGTEHPDGTKSGGGYVKDNAFPGYKWVAGATVNGKYEKGHWAKDESKDEGKHRPAGTSRWEKNDDTPKPGEAIDIDGDPRWAAYLSARYGKSGKKVLADRDLKPGQWPSQGLNVVSESPNGTPVDDLLNDIEDALGSGHSLDRADMELIAAHENPGLTPEDISSMDIVDLRELAGITAADWREQLLRRVADDFGESRYSEAELGLLTNEDLEYLLTVERTDDADAYVEAIFDEVYGPGAADEANLPVSQARITLEEDVYAAYDDLSRVEIERMPDSTLETLLDAANRMRSYYAAKDDDNPETQPLDVAEVLGYQDPDYEVA